MGGVLDHSSGDSPWQMKILKISKWQQVAVGTIAFVFWAISLGDPFQTAWKAWYQPLYGSMALMLYTFLIPLFEPESTPVASGSEGKTNVRD